MFLVGYECPECQIASPDVNKVLVELKDSESDPIYDMTFTTCGHVLTGEEWLLADYQIFEECSYCNGGGAFWD